MFDVNALSLADIAKIEELSNQPISAIGDEDKPKGKALAALAFIVGRKSNPAMTWNDAMGLTMEEATAILGLGDDEDVDLEDESGN